MNLQLLIRRRIPYIGLVVVLFLSLFLTLVAHTLQTSAAGSSVISVEASPASVSPGSNVTLRFYVTPSGASVNSVSVNVALTNLSYVSYTGSGSAFNGIAQVPGGATATNFSVIGAYQSFGGASSKALILTVTAKASGSAGTGQVSLSSAEAYDTAESAMATSVNGTNVSIAAPTTTPPSGGGSGGGGSSSGGGGSSQGSSGGSGNTSSGGSDSGTSETPQNTVVVPGTEAGAEVPGREISEAEFLSAQDEEVNLSDTKPKSLADNIAPYNKTIMSVVVGLLGLAAVALILKFIIPRVAYSRKIAGHVPTPPISNHPNTVHTPTVTPSVTPTPAVSSHPTPSEGPTIITPQNKDQ